MKTIIIFAGAASIYGLADIKAASKNSDFALQFVETPEMAKYISSDDLKEVSVKNDIKDEDSIVVPLNEYWVTWCKKNVKRCRISTKAFKASRSKKYLADCMMQQGLPSNRYEITSNVKKIVSDKQKVYIIKPDNQYSGHGVKIISALNYHNIDKYLIDASIVDEKVKKVLDITASPSICFEFIDGVEYSADVFFFQGKISVVRVCKKYRTIIDDAPCVLAYLLEEPTELIRRYLELWCNALFDYDNISFGQFDFISPTSVSNVLVPIDFSCRVGGGISELLRYHGGNLYRDSLEVLFGEKCIANKGIFQNVFQLNFIPNTMGTLINDNFLINDLQGIKLKKLGDRIDRLDPSANNRLAICLGDNFSEAYYKKIKDRLLIGSQYIKHDEV